MPANANPNKIEKEKIEEISSSESDLCCMTAAPMPKLLNKLKNEMNTPAIATTPIL